MGEVKLYNNITHDVKVLLEVKIPWINSNRVVHAYGWFGSIATAELL